MSTGTQKAILPVVPNQVPVYCSTCVMMKQRQLAPEKLHSYTMSCTTQLQSEPAVVSHLQCVREDRRKASNALPQHTLVQQQCCQKFT